MIGVRDFVGLPGSRASTWDKILKTNVKEFHNCNIRLKKKKVLEEFINLTKGKTTAEPVKSNKKTASTESSSLKTSSISSMS